MRWIIGDIHGMLKPLEGLLRAVEAADSAASLLFVGDYVNRGPDSRGVIELLLTLTNARFCRGNHDDIFDLILNGQAYVGDIAKNDPMMAFQWFMSFGLGDTLMSYGADSAMLEHLVSHPAKERLEELCAAVPENHRTFIRSLQPTIEEEEFFVTHAVWPSDRATTKPNIAARAESDEKLRRQMLWGRYPTADLTVKKAWGRVGYFGHTPVYHYDSNGQMTPIVGEKMVLLDTAVALIPAGRLTTYCADERRFIQVDRQGREI